MAGLAQRGGAAVRPCLLWFDNILRYRLIQEAQLFPPFSPIIVVVEDFVAQLLFKGLINVI